MAPFHASALLLNLPDGARDRLSEILFRPDQEAFIFDFPPGFYNAALRPGQTSYVSPSGARTTYLALDYYATVPELQVLVQQSRLLALSSQLLRVCRESLMSYEVPLYQRQFRFAGMAEGALAFLHDHRREEHRIERCWLTFSLRANVQYGPRTDLDAWRRLFNVLAHERKDLKAVGLEVGEEFWDLAPWEFADGVEKVFEKRGLLQPDGEQVEYQTPFEHFSRLPPSVELTLHGLEESGQKLTAKNRSKTTDHETCKGRILSPTWKVSSGGCPDCGRRAQHVTARAEGEGSKRRATGAQMSGPGVDAGVDEEMKLSEE